MPSSSRYGPLLVAVAAVSFGSIFVRLASAPALAVAFHRMAFAALLLAPAALGSVRQALPGLGRGPRWLLVGSAAALALHFATWVASLSYTSVAASVLLVNVSPALTLLLSWVFLREPPSLDLVAALLVALMGVWLIASFDLGRGADPFVGDLLALAGAATLSVHHVVGRGLRAALPLPAYVLSVWSMAAGLLAGLAVAAGTPLAGFSPRSYLWMLALAAGPTLVGHGLVNRSLRVLPATVVGLFLLGEPVGATLLAYGLFGEVPSGRVLTGGTLVLLSLGWLAVRGRA